MHGPGRIATTTTCCSLATVSICSHWPRPVYNKDCVFASLTSQGGRIDWTLAAGQSKLTGDFRSSTAAAHKRTYSYTVIHIIHHTVAEVDIYKMFNNATNKINKYTSP